MHSNRSVASISVLTVLTVSILIWVSIFDDDTTIPFEGIRLGEYKFTVF